MTASGWLLGSALDERQPYRVFTPPDAVRSGMGEKERKKQDKDRNREDYETERDAERQQR
jgi:hypothetical protein